MNVPLGQSGADRRVDDEQPPSVRPDAAWFIPPWVSSRSYALGTPSARAMITNARWWTSLLLVEASAELWNMLPPRFTLSDIAPRLRSVGIEIENPESRSEVLGFLDSLHREGALCCEAAANPQPDHRATKAAIDSGAVVNSIEGEFCDWLASRGMLAAAIVELTYRCNQRCVHCFNPGAAHAPGEQPHRDGDELSTEEVFALLGQLKDNGVFLLTFSGGELSTRPDLIPILREARRLGFACNLLTNGLLPEDWLREICALWPRTIAISIYSPVPEIHDATTGVPGSFQRALASLRYVAGAGVRATMKCPLMRHNVYGYKKLQDLCDELNAYPHFDFHITAAMDGKSGCTAHQILDQRVLKSLMSDQRVGTHVGPDLPDFGRRRRAMDGPVCGGGMFELSIAPDGTVSPCNMLPLALGNVRQASLREIREGKILAAWRSVNLGDFDKCGLYAYCAYCNHCPGMAMAEKGDMLAAPTTCCLAARTRMDLAREMQGDAGAAIAAAAGFGWDGTVHLPVVPAVEPCDRVHDPRRSPPEEFVTRIATIHREGNVHRKDEAPESGSPALENLKKADLQSGGLLHEFGR